MCEDSWNVEPLHGEYVFNVFVTETKTLFFTVFLGPTAQLKPLNVVSKPLNVGGGLWQWEGETNKHTNKHTDSSGLKESVGLD